MRLAFRIALRFLKSGKSQTLLIALGIGIGVSVQIFIGLLIQGLQQSLIDKTIGNASQITVVSQENKKPIENWEDKLGKIEKADSRIRNISVAADASAFVKYADKSEPVLIRGFDKERAEGIYNLKESVYEGRLFDKDSEVVVGRDLAEKLGIKLNDTITVATAEGNSAKLAVTGFFDLKVSGINLSWLPVSLKTSQELNKWGNKVTSIEMQVTEIFNADQIAVSINNSLADKNLKVDNWIAQNEQLLSGLKGQSMSSLLIQVFVLVSVLLGIASVLAITVIQKSRQIGILKAMGVKDASASLIFLFQGLLLGSAGAIAGIAFGILLVVMFAKFALNPDGTPVVPIYINYGFIAFSGIIAVAASVAASLVPAARSSKLSPIEVIRNG